MARSQPQSHGDAIRMEDSLELCTTVVRFYQQQQQQGQLLQWQQQQQQQINQQPQLCDGKDLDETNSKSHLSFPLLLHTLYSAINANKSN